MDRVQGVRRCGKNLLQCFPAMLQQMQAGCALDGRGRTLARTLGLGGRPIAGAPCAPRRLLEPRGAGRGGALREERHGLAALQVYQDRASGLTLPQGESVHATPERGGVRRDGQLAAQAQQGVPAHRQGQRLAAAPPRLATQGHAESDKALGEPQRAPRPRGNHWGEAFGEDAATAGTITAKPLADAQLETHRVLRPGQGGQGTFIMAVDAMRRGGTERTRARGLGRAYP
jgi:hypothetical protein